MEEAAALLEPAIKTLSRDVHVYHWTSRQAAGVPVAVTEKRPPGAAEYFSRTLASQFEAKDRVVGANVGLGLYAATDPVASMHYGLTHGQGWALLEVPVPKGTRLIDRDFLKRHDLPIALRKKILAAFGCPLESLSTITFSAAGCVSFRRELYRKAQVTGLIYNWTVKDAPACPGRRSAAFLLFGPSLTESRWRVVTRSRSSPESKSEREARGTLLQMIRTFSGGRNVGDEALLGISDDLPGESANLGSWMREHVFGCGEFPEDYDLEQAAASISRSRDESLARERETYRRALEAAVSSNMLSGPVETLEFREAAASGKQISFEKLKQEIHERVDPVGAHRESCGRLSQRTGRECAHCTGEERPLQAVEGQVCDLLKALQKIKPELGGSGAETVLGWIRQFYEAPTLWRLAYTDEQIRSRLMAPFSDEVREAFLRAALPMLPLGDFMISDWPWGSESESMADIFQRKLQIPAPNPLVLKEVLSKNKMPEYLRAAMAEKRIRQLKASRACLEELRKESRTRADESALPCGLARVAPSP